MSKFYHDAPCIKCEGTERYIRNNQCVSCSRQQYRESRLRNVEKRRTYDRRYQASRAQHLVDRSATKSWKPCFYSNIHRAATYGALPPHFEEERDQIETVYRKCFELNKVWNTNWVVDHVIPLAGGGKHEWSNLQLLEYTLNGEKGDQHPWSHTS